jgi:hypothetical protein
VETLALGGAWAVLGGTKYLRTGLFFAFLGLLSTIIWLLNDLINHTYILYWWRSANPHWTERTYEKNAEKMEIGRWWDKPKVGFKYSHLMHVIPIIFGAAWLWILGLFIPPHFWYIVAIVGALLLTWMVLAIAKRGSECAEQAHARAHRNS